MHWIQIPRDVRKSSDQFWLEMNKAEHCSYVDVTRDFINGRTKLRKGTMRFGWPETLSSSIVNFQKLNKLASLFICFYRPNLSVVELKRKQSRSDGCVSVLQWGCVRRRVCVWVISSTPQSWILLLLLLIRQRSSYRCCCYWLIISKMFLKEVFCLADVSCSSLCWWCEIMVSAAMVFEYLMLLLLTRWCCCYCLIIFLLLLEFVLLLLLGLFMLLLVYAALLLLCFVSSIWYIDVIGYQSYAPGLFI